MQLRMNTSREVFGWISRCLGLRPAVAYLKSREAGWFIFSRRVPSRWGCVLAEEQNRMSYVNKVNIDNVMRIERTHLAQVVSSRLAESTCSAHVSAFDGDPVSDLEVCLRAFGDIGDGSTVAALSLCNWSFSSCYTYLASWPRTRGSMILKSPLAPWL
jgi:hypothetical protein